MKILKKGDCNKNKKKDQVKRFKNKYAGPNNKFFTLHQQIRRERKRKTFCVIERLRGRGEKDKLDEMHKLDRKFVI